MENGIRNIEEEYEKLKVSHDQLERRLEEVNKKLLRSEQLKSDFLSNIKNEINNPLTSILGLLNQIIAHPEDVEKSSTKAKLIFNEAYMLDFQMKNIFHAAEIEAGQCFPLLSSLDVNELVEEIVLAFTYHAAKKNITFKKELAPDAKLVSDREKLEMILLNLVSNAIKFSDSDSEVIIKTVNKDGALTISVKDFGVGIEDQNLGQIYDRFKQLDSGTRKEFGGHGLGLSIVHSLVDIMDGTLKIESKVGKGTYFEISLPPKVLEVDEPDDEILFDSEGKGEIF